MKNRQRTAPLARGRSAVLAALRDQPDPVGIDALAQATGRHPNTLREQLAWLVAHGHVLRIRQPSVGRGRPAWLYQAARGAPPGKEEYVELAAALAWELQETTDVTYTRALAAGRHWGDQLVGARRTASNPSPRAARRWTVELMDELGYHPTADDDDIEVVLHRCPLLQAAHRFPDVVCTIHLGLVQSALEGNGGDPNSAELTPFAAAGECHLKLGLGVGRGA